MASKQDNSHGLYSNPTQDVLLMPRITHSQFRKDRRKNKQSVRTDETLRLAAKGFRQQSTEEEIPDAYWEKEQSNKKKGSFFICCG